MENRERSHRESWKTVTFLSTYCEADEISGEMKGRGQENHTQRNERKSHIGGAEIKERRLGGKTQTGLLHMKEEL